MLLVNGQGLGQLHRLPPCQAIHQEHPGLTASAHGNRHLNRKASLRSRRLLSPITRSSSTLKDGQLLQALKQRHYRSSHKRSSIQMQAAPVCAETILKPCVKVQYLFAWLSHDRLCRLLKRKKLWKMRQLLFVRKMQVATRVCGSNSNKPLGKLRMKFVKQSQTWTAKSFMRMPGQDQEVVVACQESYR